MPFICFPANRLSNTPSKRQGKPRKQRYSRYLRVPAGLSSSNFPAYLQIPPAHPAVALARLRGGVKSPLHRLGHRLINR